MDIENALEACDYLSNYIALMQKEIPTLGFEDVGKSCEAFVAARRLKDRIEEVSKEAGAVIQEYAEHHMPTLLERHNLEFAPHRLGRITMETRFSTKVIDKEGAHAWLKNNGMSNLIIQTINAQTISAVARTWIEKGKELPTKFFQTTIKTYAKVHLGDD